MDGDIEHPSRGQMGSPFTGETGSPGGYVGNTEIPGGFVGGIPPGGVCAFGVIDQP